MDMGNLAKWLSLPAKDWPPDYFRLVGLKPGEGTADDIESRVFERMEILRPYQLKYPEEVTEGMNLLAQAMVCLCDPATRSTYEKSIGIAKPVHTPPELPITQFTPIPLIPAPPKAEVYSINVPLPVARQVISSPKAEGAVAAEKQVGGRDRRRKPIRERVYLSRFVRLLRQFESLMDAPLRTRHPQRDARTLQTVCQSIIRTWNSPQWPILKLEGQGERLLSIAKILARYPSFDYLVSNQLQDIHHDVSRELQRLESQRSNEIYERQQRRQRRLHRWRYYHRARRLFWQPERLIAPISILTFLVGLFRWMF